MLIAISRDKVNRFHTKYLYIKDFRSFYSDFFVTDLMLVILILIDSTKHLLCGYHLYASC